MDTATHGEIAAMPLAFWQEVVEILDETSGDDEWKTWRRKIIDSVQVFAGEPTTVDSSDSDAALLAAQRVIEKYKRYADKAALGDAHSFAVSLLASIMCDLERLRIENEEAQKATPHPGEVGT